MLDIPFLESFFSWFEPLVNSFYRLGVNHDLAFFGLFAVLFAIWLGFAWWAARTAGLAYRSRLGNFVLGLLIPVVYALILPRVIRRQRQRQRALQKQEEAARKARKIALPEDDRYRTIGKPQVQPKQKETEPGPASEAASSRSGAEPGPPTGGESDREKYSRFFQWQRQLQKQNEALRPMRVFYADNEIVMERVLEVMEQVVVVQTRARGQQGTSQSLRIPLARIFKIEREQPDGSWQPVDIHQAPLDEPVE